MEQTGATSPATTNGIHVSFWIVGGLLVLYVALCTGRRDLIDGSDAWEHHRAIKVLSQRLWHPGNPTMATDQPSVRYSPYAVAQALISRGTGWDPYKVLSGAAVFNTAFLIVGVGIFLSALGRGRSATAALIIMVSLYGVAPGYANSYALADLPWHEVNPSAFAFDCTLLAWGLLARLLRGDSRRAHAPTIVVLIATALLDHPMTGVAGGIGLLALAGMAADPTRRLAMIGLVIKIGAMAFLLCLFWPWYSFWSALRSRPDANNWYNSHVLLEMLTVWCAPGFVLGLFALAADDSRTARILLTAALVYSAMGVAALFVRSPSLARMPLPGLVFFHLALAVFADDAQLLGWRSWPARFRALVRSTPSAARPVMELVVVIAVVGYLAPQLATVARQPYLARPLLERLVGRHVPARVSIRERLDRLLPDIGERDVVLSDLLTSWAIPSSRGRVVAGFHPELFVPDQPARDRAVAAFFGVASDEERLRIIDRYDVRWIVVDASTTPSAVSSALLDATAAVRSEGPLTLMDARLWVQDHRRQPH